MRDVPVSETGGGHGYGARREVWVKVTKKLKLNECTLTADWQWFPFDIQTVGLAAVPYDPTQFRFVDFVKHWGISEEVK